MLRITKALARRGAGANNDPRAGGGSVKRFKRLKSVRKSYEEQGRIYFTCATYGSQPESVRRRIDRLCESVGGEYAPALRCFLTTGADWITVCRIYNISSATLERLRRAFFEAW